METNLEVLDLSGQKLIKLNKAQIDEFKISTLILDENDLQKLDNIDSYSNVSKLSIVRNQLIRMYGICRMHNLSTLNLAHNGIITIEGLKELLHLKCLCLAGNNIKTIEHLNTNTNLEHLDLSENNITHISDISYLKKLKELLVHGNRIGHLRQCERYLPSSLVTLTLASNNIADLNEISQLVHLNNLNNFSITGNPCVCMAGNKVGFDYRPFVINWLMSLKVIDGYVVDAIESLRAEWLYSQGRGRHFRIGDHQELIQYLASVCPPSGETLQTEEDRKLRLILSKAQHHQQQLRDQLTANGSTESSPTPSPNTKRKVTPRNSSPRMNSASSRTRPRSPERMTASCIMTNSQGNYESSVMTQSLDPAMLSNVVAHRDELNGISEEGQLYASSPLQAATKLVPVPESLMSPDYRPSSIIPPRVICQRNTTIPAPTGNRQIPNTKKEQPRGSPKLSRTPHSSPRQQRSATGGRSNNSSPLRTRKSTTSSCLHNEAPSNIQQNGITYTTFASQSTPPNSGNSRTQSSDEDSEMCESKLMVIRNLAQERQCIKEPLPIKQVHQTLSDIEAAIRIQKLWRGYYTRNVDKKSTKLIQNIKETRTQQHLEKLADDMEKAKEALECERKIQMLQMQAINALWQKVSSMQSDKEGETSNINLSATLNSSNSDVSTLTKTCNMLSSQVQQLQGSMQDVVKCLNSFCQLPCISQQLQECGISTQTEIIAVHTPQGDAGKNFPFQRTPRPSSLALTGSQCGRQNDALPTNDASEEVQQYAGTLVDDAIKLLSETATEPDSLEDVRHVVVNETLDDSEQTTE